MPTTYRRAIYAALVLAGIVLGGVHVGFDSAVTPDPTWLTVASAVYAYLMAPATGVLALLNVPASGGGEHVAPE